MKSRVRFSLATGVVLAVSLLFVACQKDSDDGVRRVTLKAVIDNSANGAKVYIDDERYACWHHGDAVNINGSDYTLSVASSGSAKAATITGVTESDAGYTAVYPADRAAGVTAAGDAVTVTIPAVQTYTTPTVFDGSGTSYQYVETPMVGHCDAGDEVIKFRNVGSLLKVTVTNSTGYDLAVHYLTVTASKDGGSAAYLAGEASVDLATYAMAAPTAGNHSLTLDCSASPVALAGGGGIKSFYLACAPFSGQKLTVRVLAKDEDGEDIYYTFVATTSGEGTLTRNGMAEAPVTISECVCASATGNCDYLFWGCGTEANPFIIANYNDLNRLRNIVNYRTPYNTATHQTTYNSSSIHYLQIADINVGTNSAPWGANTTSENCGIGYTGYPFSAHYDGGDHTVQLASVLGTGTSVASSLDGIVVGVGLFGVCGGGGSIKNLNVAGSIGTNSRSRTVVGGVVGLVSGAFSLTDCTSALTLTRSSSGSNYAYHGGMIGFVKASGATVSLTRCTFSGSLAASGDYIYVGSMVGYVYAATSCTLTDCVNTTRAVTSSYGYAGGMVGYTTAPLSFTRCKNYWSITASSKSYVAGLVGYPSSASATITIDACENHGTMTGYTYVAGFVGGNTVSGLTVNITGNCLNDQLIHATCTTTSVYSGGLVGRADNLNINTTAATDTVKNTGNVNGYSAMGGIAGYVGTLTIDGNVVNTGNIYVYSNNTNLGGIVGQTATACYINKDCSDFSKKVINRGQLTSGGSNHGVTGTSAGTGGIIGDAVGTIQIKNCFNDTLVYNKGQVGGIVGYISVSGVSYIENCKNTGRIRGHNTESYGCGGIVGDLRCASNATAMYIRNCGNEGRVVTGNLDDGTGSYKGYASGIVGFVYSNGIVRLNIQNCYSDGAPMIGKYAGGIITAKKNSSNNLYVSIDNCYFNGTLTGATNKGSVTYNETAVTAMDIYRCYSDDVTTSSPTLSEGANTTSGSKNAGRTFAASTGLFSACSANATAEPTWTSGTSLVDALNSRATTEGYRAWVTPTGQVLPRLSGM